MKKVSTLFSLAFIALAFLHRESLAQFNRPDSLMQNWSAEPGLWSILKVMFLLGLVLALIWISLNALKKVSRKGGGSLRGVEVVGGVPLGTRKSLIFVKISGKIHIIGATDQQLCAIGVIDDPAEVAVILADVSGKNIVPFRDIFSRLTGRSDTPAKPEGGDR